MPVLEPVVVTTLAAGVTWVDLLFLGRPHAIVTGVLHGAPGVALVDPGPTTCLATLEAGLGRHGLSLADVTHVLLTHIHLDHAAAAGAIVRRQPRARVLVHERGAAHVIDPTKLIESATRLYGDQMDRLWGEIAPVPAGQVDVLRGGEVIEAGGRALQVAYTPGHASHHVSFFDASSRVAFVGDTGGVCIEGGYVLPPTTPPDVDLDLWAESVGTIEAWAPETLFLTHGGPVGHVRPHLRTLLENLDTVARLARRALAVHADEAEARAWFGRELGVELRRYMPEGQAATYETAAPSDLLWAGLSRYWRKRDEGVPPPGR
jgi:glyoxylase-like metal-dependent hydrolase (beta-lactamase superfamily II)